ncbi:MAG: T9SS type A sorting domain-containing protein [Syntrophothermus sp.]
MNRTLLKSVVFTILLSACIQAQWVKTGLKGGTVQDIAAKDSLLYAISQKSFYISKDNGATWDSLSSFTAPEPQHILFLNDTIFVYGNWTRVAGAAAEDEPCIFRSDDGGHSWKVVLSGFMGAGSVAISGRTLFSTKFLEHLLKSTDYGDSWDTLSLTPPSPAQLDFLFSHNGNLYTAQYGGGLFKSTNDGLNWKDVSGSLRHPGSTLMFAGSKYVFVINDSLFYRSSNEGESWDSLRVPLTPRISVSNAISTDSLIFLTGLSRDTFNIKLYSGTISSNQWKDITPGLPEATILLPHALAVKDNWLFLASSNGLWKYDLSHLLAVEDNQALVNTYKLSQNYPNPFNPATTISYSIPKASFVKLKVYDMLGRVVQTLVNKEQSAGSYKVRFEASSLPSGMYIYEIRSDNFIKSGKMLLLK